jgi:hypothetical protein
MINNVNIDNDSFNEIYLNIPAGAGRSTNVHFNNISDDNYAFNKSIEVNNDYIIGRDPSILGMEDDITLEAIYDNYELGVDSDEGNINRRKYFIDNGYCINFSDNLYGDGKGIETMNLESEDDFEFNCVLIYYKIRKGDGNWYTNLYGVLFLEDVIMSDYSTVLNYDDERGGYIQRYPKFKKGNSWGLKLDLKIDAQPDSQLVIRDSEYEDPNKGGVGMQMFTEALMQLNDCSKLFYGVKKENSDIKERLNKLENIVTGIDSLYDLRNEVYNLSGGINNYKQSIYVLDGRIGSLEDKVEELEKNIGYLITVISSMNSSNKK